jgi:hypothetical protein
MSTTKKTSNKPVEKFQLRGISASVFENTSDNGAVFYKVSITRTYKDGDEFKTTSVFSRDDLPVVELLTRQAWVSILKRESSGSQESE